MLCEALEAYNTFWIALDDHSDAVGFSSATFLQDARRYSHHRLVTMHQIQSSMVSRHSGQHQNGTYTARSISPEHHCFILQLKFVYGSASFEVRTALYGCVWDFHSEHYSPSTSDCPALRVIDALEFNSEHRPFISEEISTTPISFLISINLHHRPPSMQSLNTPLHFSLVTTDQRLLFQGAEIEEEGEERRCLQQ